MVSNCGKNEFGGVSGGTAGDQTGAEYWVINWYNFGQTVVYRFPNLAVGALIAELAEAAAENSNIGYDQPTRLTFYQQLQAASWNPAAITTPCAADCSSATAAIVLAAGHILAKKTDEKLKAIGERIVSNVDPNDTTYNMGEDLANAGFVALRASKYLTSDANLLPGDINLNDTAHVNINISTGANAAVEEQSVVVIPSTADADDDTTDDSTDVAAEETSGRLNVLHLSYGSGLNSPLPRVKAVQNMLIEQGYIIDADGEFGKITEAAVLTFQEDRIKFYTENGEDTELEINGVVDANTWAELFLLEE